MHLALQSRACVIALVILMDGMAPAHGQVSLVLGGALMTGKLQTPYVRPCSGEDASAFGPIAYAGFGLSAFSVTAGYVTVTRGFGGDCFSDPPPGDGVYRVREFRVTHSSIYGWAFHLRYSPDSWPIMAYTGAGYRFGGNELGGNKFVSLGAALRTRGRLSVFAGGEVTQLRTQFIRYDRVMQGGIVASETEVDRGYGWRKLEVIRFGLEYRWKLTGGRDD